MPAHQTTYQRPDGSAYVHVVEECPRHYFLAYIVKKGWPLLPRVNHILSKFSEAGKNKTCHIYLLFVKQKQK